MFWRRYANLCEAVGKAPNVVAAEVGVKSSGTVTGWKNGAIPRPSVLAKLAEYFGVSVYELTGEKKEKPIPEDGDGLDEGALEQEFMRWFRMQPLDRQKEILFDLVQAVPGPGQGE